MTFENIKNEQIEEYLKHKNVTKNSSYVYKSVLTGFAEFAKGSEQEETGVVLSNYLNTKSGSVYKRDSYILNDFYNFLTTQKAAIPSAIPAAQKTETKITEELVKAGNLQIAPINENEYFEHMTMEEKYITHDGEFEMVGLHGKIKRGIILEGEAGTGKTLALRAYAQKEKIPFVMVTCSEYMTDLKLLISTQLVNGSSMFCLGFLPTAIELANKYGAAMINLDEINTLNIPTQKLLNDFMNTGYVHLPYINRAYHLNKDVTLFICGTQNPVRYAGTNQLNTELLSRFTIYPIEDFDNDKITQLLKPYNIDAEVVERLLRLKQAVKSAYQNNTVSYQIDNRELVAFGRIYREMKDANIDNKVKKSLCVFLGKFTVPEEKIFINQTIETIFGITRK